MLETLANVKPSKPGNKIMAYYINNRENAQENQISKDDIATIRKALGKSLLDEKRKLERKQAKTKEGGLQVLSTLEMSRIERLLKIFGEGV